MVEPTSIKWLDVQTGDGETYLYAPPLGKERKLTITIPSQFVRYIKSSEGIQVTQRNGPITIQLKGDLGDYIELRGPITITMTDLGNTVKGVKPSYYWEGDLPQRGGFTILKRASFRVPTLKFRMCGINYELDWDTFKNTRHIASGATGEQWGYEREGYPTYGEASLYDVVDAAGNDPTVIILSWTEEVDTPQLGGVCVNCPNGYTKNEEGKCITSAGGEELSNMWLYGAAGVGALVLLMGVMKKKKGS